MKKRGQLSHQVIIEIVILVLITAAFFYFHKTVQENTLFEKSYAVRDIALLMETVESAPGEIEMYYTQPTFDIGKYTYSFTDNLLRMYESDAALAATYYPFFLDTAVENYLGTLEKPAAFVVTKEKNMLEVKEFGSILQQQDKKITCPTAASTKKTYVSLVVLSDDISFAKIQNDLLNNPKLGFAKPAKDPSAITEKTSVVLVLTKEEGNRIRSFIPDDEQSEKLACLMTNNIVEETTADPVAPTISVDTQLTTNTNGLAVQLIVGDDLLEDTVEVSSAIQNALEEYAHD